MLLFFYSLVALKWVQISMHKMGYNTYALAYLWFLHPPFIKKNPKKTQKTSFLIFVEICWVSIGKKCKILF